MGLVAESSRSGTKKVTLLEVDIIDALNRQLVPKLAEFSEHIKSIPGEYELKVSAYVDPNTYKRISSESVLLAKITEAVSTEYKKTYDLLAEILTTINKAVKNSDQLATAIGIGAFEQIVPAEEKRLKKAGLKAALDAFKKYDQVQLDHEEFEAKMTAEMKVSGVSLLAGLGGLALEVGTGGLSSFFSGGTTAVASFWALSKGIVQGSQLTLTYYRDADQQRLICEASLKDIFDKYAEKSSLIVSLSETGTAVAEFLTGAGNLINQGIEDAIENLETYKSKLDGLDVQSREVASKIEPLFESIEP